MEEGVQKASITKRISAGIIDIIAVSIIATLFAWIITLVSGYDIWNEKLEDSYSHYENLYGVTFRITEEEYYSLSDMDRADYDAEYKALLEDQDAMKAYSMVTNLMILTLSIGIFVAILIC